MSHFDLKFSDLNLISFHLTYLTLWHNELHISIQTFMPLLLINLWDGQETFKKPLKLKTSKPIHNLNLLCVKITTQLTTTNPNFDLPSPHEPWKFFDRIMHLNSNFPYLPFLIPYFFHTELENLSYPILHFDQEFS